MVKKLIAAAILLIGTELYICDKSVLIQASNVFFQELSSNPEIIYLLGAFVITFALLLWRSRRDVTQEI